MNDRHAPDGPTNRRGEIATGESLRKLVNAVVALATKEEKPSSFRRIVNRLELVRSFLVSAILIAVLLGGGIQLWKQFHARTILIEPFGVTEELEKRGYAPRVVANLLADRCARIQKRINSGVDLGEFARGDEPNPSVNVPEAHVALKAICGYIAQLFGHSPRRITGEFVGSGR